MAPPSSVNTGGDYLAVRNAMASKYILPWMEAVHEHDNNAYTVVLYELCEEVAAEQVKKHQEVSLQWRIAGRRVLTCSSLRIHSR